MLTKVKTKIKLDPKTIRQTGKPVKHPLSKPFFLVCDTARLRLHLLADGPEELAEALQGLLVRRPEELVHALVHDLAREQAELEQLADEPENG